MPYKKKLARKSKLSPVVIAYLSDDETVFTGSDDWFLWNYRHGLPGFDGDPKPDELWKKHRDEFLPAFISNHPGRRPLPWWQWDAPKETVPGWEGEQFNVAQRKRLGGIGTPSHEVLAIWGGFTRGLPNSWVDQYQVELYNGRAKDIHGNIIPTEYKEGDFKGVAIDPNDPPVYESEAAYLERLGLLTPAEKKYLEKYRELLTPERIKFDDE